MNDDGEDSELEGPACLTCLDQAECGRVVRFLHGDVAIVDMGCSLEEVDLALVDARPGDLVLVHARVAIGKVS